jgi:hypothetical protein
MFTCVHLRTHTYEMGVSVKLYRLGENFESFQTLCSSDFARILYL